MGNARIKREQVLRCRGMNVVARVVARPWPARGRILFVGGAIMTMSALRWAEMDLKGFEVAAFDYPLIGASRALNPDLDRLDREDEVAILSTVIEQVRPDYLVSQSWGGAAALWALSERPPSIRRAIISSFSFEVSAPLRALCQRIVGLVGDGRRSEGAILAVREIGAELPERVQQAYAGYFDALDAQQLRYVLRQMEDVTALSGAHHRERLERIDIPVLFGNGALDRVTPPESARPFAGCIASADFLTIPDAGHFLAIESKAAGACVCAGIEAFFGADGASLSRSA